MRLLALEKPMTPVKQIPHLNVSFSSRALYMCIVAGDQEIYRIDDLQSFQAALGYAPHAKDSNLLFDEFIWSEYKRESAPQSPADLQAKLVEYLYDRCPAFRMKYFEKDQEDTSSIWDESMRIGIPAYDDQRKDLAGLIELLDKDQSHSNTNENFLGRFHTLQVAVQEYFVREESLMEQMHLPAELLHQHHADHVAIVDMFLNTYIDSMHHTGRTAFEVYWQVKEALKHHFETWDTKLKAYAGNI